VHYFSIAPGEVIRWNEEGEWRLHACES
jgi:hypothetical protein